MLQRQNVITSPTADLTDILRKEGLAGELRGIELFLHIPQTIISTEEQIIKMLSDSVAAESEDQERNDYAP